jgi:hypothetical protein
MYVRELIALLEKLPEEREVVLGGVEDDTHPFVGSVRVEWSDQHQMRVVLILPY